MAKLKKMPDEPKRRTELAGLDGRSFTNRVDELLRRAKIAGLNVDVFEAKRSTKRQKWMHKHLAAGPDGKKRRSSHQDSLGVDIVFKDEKGEWSWAESNDWNQLGEIAESVGLAWGGRWKKPVRSHFQSRELFDIFEITDIELSHGAIASCGGCSSCSSNL